MLHPLKLCCNETRTNPMPDVAKPFILNDENVQNSYGFYVRTEGIDLGRFEQNPVMLSDHNNSNSAVLGKWVNLKKEGSILSAEPEFDLEDEDAKKIAGKVDRGYIKGASMGLLFSREDLIYLNGKIILNNSELAEGTIIPVPSNSGALRLYLKGQEEKPLSEDEVKNICLSLGNEPQKEFKPKNSMKKIVLSLAAFAALGFDNPPNDGIDEAELNSKITGLKAKLTASEAENANLKAVNKELTDAQAAAQLAAATKLVDDAIAEQRITADKRETFLSLAKSNLPLAQETLAALPAKVSLAGTTVKGGTAATAPDGVKSLDDFEKLTLSAQLAFKKDHPDEYAKLFN
jgi:hypothetical protein